MSTGQAARGGLLAVLGLLTVLAGCGGQPAGNKSSSDYPGGKPVRLVAPAEPGSGWDTTAHAMADVLEQEGIITHPLLVENRTGATGAVWLSQMVNEYQGADNVIAVTSLPIMSNYVRGDSKYDYKDVTMIARFITEYYMVAVSADSEYEDLGEFLNAVKEDPGSVPIGAAGDDRLPFALLVQAAGGNPRNINFVSYEGEEQTAALLNGDIEAAMAGVSEFRGQLESGDLRGLGVLRDDRLAPPLDDIPTVKDLGYNVELDNWRGMYGPPGMPQEAVRYWQNTLQRMIRTEAWNKTAARNHWETTYMQGERLDEYLAETQRAVRTGLEQTGEIR